MEKLQHYMTILQHYYYYCDYCVNERICAVRFNTHLLILISCIRSLYAKFMLMYVYVCMRVSMTIFTIIHIYAVSHRHKQGVYEIVYFITMKQQIIEQPEITR